MSGYGEPTPDTDDVRLFDVDVIAPEVLGDDATTRRPLIDEDGRVRLSYSAIDRLRRCPLQFRYSRIDRMPTRPSPQMSLGTSVHSALQSYWDRRLPLTPALDEVLQALYHSWDRSGYADLEREEELAWYRTAQDMVRAHWEQTSPTWQPAAACEQWFDVAIGDDATVIGSIDRLDVDEDGALHVIDYKTGRLGNQASVEGSLQLAIYALACERLWGRLPATVSLQFLASGIDVVVPIDRIDLDGARATISAAAQIVLAGDFRPTPGGVCERCDFRRTCPVWATRVEAGDSLGELVGERDRLRREVVRDLTRLRHLESGVARLTDEVTARAANGAGPQEEPPVP